MGADGGRNSAAVANYGWGQKTAVEDGLFAEGHSFDFFQAVRLLEILNTNGGERLNSPAQGADPTKEIVHFRSSVALDFPASDIAQVKRKIKHVYHRVKQAGRAVVAKVARVSKKVASSVRDAYHASAKWVKDHKNAIIEIAAIGVGILGGLACTAVTAGAGAVACMVGAAALINVAKDAAEGNLHNWGDLAQSAGTGALQGLAGGAGGAIGGRVAAGLSSKLGKFGLSFVGRAASGATSGAVGDASTQLMLTGRVNAKGVVISAGIGAVFGGFNGGRSRRGTETDEGGGGVRACRHSFDPGTPVLMANGTTRPIKDVRVGDQVLTTDPASGTTTARTVEALHRNRDTDLADVTVAAGGTVTTIRTTQHHPFWDAAAGRWTDAARLTPGRSTLVDPSGGTVRVLDVRAYAGEREMRDLTVATVHTYYVLAAAQAVLVHNCAARRGDDPDGEPDGPDGAGPRRKRTADDENEQTEENHRTDFKNAAELEQFRRERTSTEIGIARNIDGMVHGTKPHGFDSQDPVTTFILVVDLTASVLRRAWKNRKNRGQPRPPLQLPEGEEPVE